MAIVSKGRLLGLCGECRIPLRDSSLRGTSVMRARCVWPSLVWVYLTMASRAKTFVQHPPKIRAVVTKGPMPATMTVLDYSARRGMFCARFVFPEAQGESDKSTANAPRRSAESNGSVRLPLVSSRHQRILVLLLVGCTTLVNLLLRCHRSSDVVPWMQRRRETFDGTACTCARPARCCAIDASLR